MSKKQCYFKNSILNYKINFKPSLYVSLSLILTRFTSMNAVFFTFTQFKKLHNTSKKILFFLTIYFQKNNFYQNTDELDKLLQQSNKEKIVLERQLALKYSQVIPNQGDFSNSNNPNKQQLNTIKVL